MRCDAVLRGVVWWFGKEIWIRVTYVCIFSRLQKVASVLRGAHLRELSAR